MNQLDIASAQLRADNIERDLSLKTTGSRSTYDIGAAVGTLFVLLFFSPSMLLIHSDTLYSVLLVFTENAYSLSLCVHGRSIECRIFLGKDISL